MTINGLECKLVEKRGKKAEIEIDNQKVIIPSEKLPTGIEIGETFELYFSSQKSAKMKERDLAKAILEEILNGN